MRHLHFSSSCHLGGRFKLLLHQLIFTSCRYGNFQARHACSLIQPGFQPYSILWFSFILKSQAACSYTDLVSVCLQGFFLKQSLIYLNLRKMVRSSICSLKHDDDIAPVDLMVILLVLGERFNLYPYLITGFEHMMYA